MPWQPMYAKINQNCTDFSCVQDMEAISACMLGLSRSANSNMLSEVYKEQRMLPGQSNLGTVSQNCNKLGHNFGPMQTIFGVCVENMVWVTEFTYAENIIMGP